ncbi:MAG TPA: serine/threonine-protein kinase, partial [Kofleriaceae bacterium]|nr:serine/threonine-protein kinase [Kofleriaceae bacterium]
MLQVIGTGGMAVVYLVEHQTLLKRFAAKVLSNELASSAEARARFAQEAHAASQLDHENIVTISDFGVAADQRPFFVMELLRGQTLDQRLGDSPMSIEEVVAVAVPVARALAHAHAEGIVHRDVKPENIFLVQRSQGRWGVKVVDFGIAKTPINPKLTNMNETLGSPLFMAPEMIRGEDDVDQRTDVYSFGVLLYLMLCGRLPFFDENLLKVMQMHLATPVPPPRSVKPSLSDELARVLDRALAKHSDDRYPSMDSLLIDLEAALPPGADRLLIEAQSGAARGETPFATTLAMTRDSQRTPRITPSEPALRTMRVSPLPAPNSVLPVTPLRPPAPRRVGIVVASALVSGVVGVAVYWKVAGRAGRHTTAASPPAALAVAKSIAPPPAAPSAPPPSQPPAAAPAPASATPAPASAPPDSEPAVAADSSVAS